MISWSLVYNTVVVLQIFHLLFLQLRYCRIDGGYIVLDHGPLSVS
jgi:hypothetical protein